MHRSGAKTLAKGRRTKAPTARKASRTRSPTDNRQKQLVKRLKLERDEALELQAASAEVLKIISSSPSNLKSVFEAMLAKALRICEAKFWHVLLYDGERFHAAHLHDVPPAYRAFWEQHGPIKPSLQTGLGRLVRTKQVAHIPDLKADPAYAEREPLRVVSRCLNGWPASAAAPCWACAIGKWGFNPSAAIVATPPRTCQQRCLPAFRRRWRWSSR